VLPMLEQEARERQVATLGQGEADPDRAILPERDTGRAREKAAELVGAGAR